MWMIHRSETIVLKRKYIFAQAWTKYYPKRNTTAKLTVKNAIGGWGCKPRNRTVEELHSFCAQHIVACRLRLGHCSTANRLLIHHPNHKHSISPRFFCWLSKTAVGHMASVSLVLFMSLFKFCEVIESKYNSNQIKNFSKLRLRLYKTIKLNCNYQ